MVENNKDKINVLTNIENYTGEHSKRIMPAIITLVLILAPALVYFIFLMSVIPLKIALIVWAFWSIRWLMIIPGKESQKKEEMRQSMHDVYASADEIIRVAHIHDDGLIEYENGSVAYILSGYAMTYINDDSFSLDLEDFLTALDYYDVDYTCQLATEEFKLQNDMSKMKVYTDKELMKERMNFYIEQDKECSDKCEVYRLNFIVKSSKYNWKTMRDYLDNLIKSDTAHVFKFIWKCDRRMAEDVASRDLCLDLNLERMQMRKYKNDEFMGSKVLFYGDETPKEYIKEKETAGIEKRRVVYKG